MLPMHERFTLRWQMFEFDGVSRCSVVRVKVMAKDEATKRSRPPRNTLTEPHHSANDIARAVIIIHRQL